MNANTVSPLWHVYVRKGAAYVPDVAQTEASYFLDVNPVRVAELDALPSLAAAIDQAMSSGNRRIPTPTRAAFPKPTLLKDAGVKTWKALVERGACFTILREEDGIKLVETGRDDRGDWVDDPTLDEKLPINSSALDIAKRIAERAGRRNDLT